MRVPRWVSDQRPHSSLESVLKMQVPEPSSVQPDFLSGGSQITYIEKAPQVISFVLKFEN